MRQIALSTLKTVREAGGSGMLRGGGSSGLRQAKYASCIVVCAGAVFIQRRLATRKPKHLLTLNIQLARR